MPRPVFLKSAVAVGCAVAVCVAVARHRHGSGVAHLQVEFQDPRFTCTSDGHIRSSVLLRNTGTSAAVIHGVETGCGCTSAALSATEIMPGDTAELQVTLRPELAKPGAYVVNAEHGIVSVAMACDIAGNFSPDLNAPFRVSLTGELPLPLSLAGSVIDMGRLPLLDGTAVRAFPIKLTDDVTQVTAECPANGVHTEFVALDSQADSALIVAIDPNRVHETSATRGWNSEFIRIRCEGGNDSNLRSVDIPLLFEIVDPITTAPRRVLAGPMTVGESVLREVNLIPDGAHVTSITSATVTDEDAEVTIRRSENTDGSLRLTLCVTPGIAGNRNIGLAINTTVSGAVGEWPIVIPVSVVAAPVAGDSR